MYVYTNWTQYIHIMHIKCYESVEIVQVSCTTQYTLYVCTDDLYISAGSINQLID